MEKIVALIDKLQELKHDETALSEMTYYTQLLYAELMCAASHAGNGQPASRKKVAVILPGQAGAAVRAAGAGPAAVPENAQPARAEVPVLEPEVAVVDYGRGEATEEVSLFATHEVREESEGKGRERTGSRELNEVMAEHKPSLNELLKAGNIELAAKLTFSAPVKDLTKALGINDKFLFINELFRGDRNMFDRSVKTINECGSLAEAEYWIGRELKIKLGWEDADEVVQQFYQLVKKRFS